MASNNYRMLIEAQLDPKKVQSQVMALQNKTKLVLNFQLNTNDLKKLQGELDKLRNAGNQIGKVKLTEDSFGGISKAVIEYKNGLGQVERVTKSIGQTVGETKTRYVDMAKVARELEKTDERIAKLKARQSDEMARAALSADKFLAKAQNMAQTKSVSATMAKAQEIKVAVSQGDIAKVRQLSDEFKVLQAGLTRSRTGLASWASGLQDAMKRTVEYSLSIGLLYGAMAKLKEGVTFISDLNTEMTKIQVLQVDGAKTNEQIADLGLKYNELGKELSATTIEVAQGSVEWLRQGKTIEETGELLRSTIYLSKLGNLETAESTEYLTAILNGFNKSSEEAVDVVNKLVAIDNIAATSAGELATGLQYSSAVANEAGVSFENLAAMIGAVSSNTRLSAEMIGTAFRTMFVRMQTVKAGGIDETGKFLARMYGNIQIVLYRIKNLWYNQKITISVKGYS